MMKQWLGLLLLLCITASNSLCAFQQVVIWGHKLHTHPHSYVHYGFYRAFEALGYPTYWLDNSDDVNNFDFSNTLFLTEGQVDNEIPLRKDCQYILHNVNIDKYQSIPRKNIIKIQIYNNSVFSNRNIVKIDTCVFYDYVDQCVFLPWAAYLLPKEIEEIQSQLPFKKQKAIHWVEPIGTGRFGNFSEVNLFMTACKKHRIPFFKSYEGIDNKDLQAKFNLIKSSYIAPTIVGSWFNETDCIPTSLFINICAGQMGITNSKQAYELLNRKIIYHPDPFQLFYEAQDRLKTITVDDIIDLMNLVKEKHTYLNRVEILLELLLIINNL